MSLTAAQCKQNSWAAIHLPGALGGNLIRFGSLLHWRLAGKFSSFAGIRDRNESANITAGYSSSGPCFSMMGVWVVRLYCGLGAPLIWVSPTSAVPAFV